MAKVMLFIDGTWLYSNNHRLSEVYGSSDFRLDFGKLPGVLAEEVGKTLGPTDVDVVRTYLFGSYAANYDLQDEGIVARRIDFFDMLKEEYHFEVETFAINFRGRRIRAQDRDHSDDFSPKEKCVDIALATTMLYLAATPFAYDIAVAVIGDRDYIPMLQSVRRLGKRVAVASIKNSCAREFADPLDEERIKDFDIIWIDSLLDRLELKYEKRALQCESPTHKGDRTIWTDYHPRKGRKFFCKVCMTESAREKEAAQQQYVSTKIEPIDYENEGSSDQFETKRRGMILNLKPEGYGFIESDDGNYFFHLNDLVEIDFENLSVGLPVDFDIKTPAYPDKAGSARNVRHIPDPLVEEKEELSLDGIFTTLDI